MNEEDQLIAQLLARELMELTEEEIEKFEHLLDSELKVMEMN
mgnify:CR=1 FL=1